jgi:hypothetical protein
MTKASTDLQDLRRRIYVKAKAEPSWRFWGLYVHVCKRETLSLPKTSSAVWIPSPELSRVYSGPTPP